MDNFKGIIIEESLDNKEILKEIKITKTEVEKVTDEHKTPWISQWTMHTIEIPDKKAKSTAEKISKAIDKEHNWYADFKNSSTHYIIFRNKVFKVNRNNKDEYEKVKKYGISLGIPDYQLDFSPNIK